MTKHYIRFPGFKKKALTLSYDDCVRQDKRLISIMQKYGLKGTFNVNSGMFADSFDKNETCGRMTKSEALELYNQPGIEVAVHGYKHLSLDKVDSDLAINDVVYDRRELENCFGRVIKGMAYANGAYNDEVVEILKKSGISYARTIISTEKFDLPTDWLRLPTTCHHANPKLMQLAEEFVKDEGQEYYWATKMQLFYLWGHSYEFDQPNGWEIIEKFAKFIGGRENIWYATNGEIYDYLQASNQLQFSADGKFVRNMSCMDIYIDYIENKRIIYAGKTIEIKTGKVID